MQTYMYINSHTYIIYTNAGTHTYLLMQLLLCGEQTGMKTL